MRPDLAAVLLAALAVLAVSGCSSDPLIDDTFDGNVVIGDATRVDSRDAALADAKPDAMVTDATSSDVITTDSRIVDADLDAGGEDAMVICADAPVATLTASAAATQARALDGVVVDITATATVGPLSCTEIACGAGNPCCNRCTGPVVLDGIVEILSNRCFASPGCEGTECRVVCMPLTLGIEGTYRGVLRHQPQAQLTVGLELQSSR